MPGDITRSSLFEQLLPYTWRGIAFPCASFEVELTQDHVEHKYPDRDGARVEGTGRNPLVFHARVLFRNGIARGGFEELYPTTFRMFLAACGDRSTGELQHPELGKVQVKCKSAKVHWDANKRDGVDVDVVWVETIDDKISLVDLGGQSPVLTAVLFAHDLDSQVSQYKWASPPPGIVFPEWSSNVTRPLPGVEPATFTQLIASIQALFELPGTVSRATIGKIDEMAYRLESLSAAIDRARDPQTWPIRQSTEHMKSALHDMKKHFVAAEKQVSIFTVRYANTLAGIAAYLGIAVEELLKLNPHLLSQAVIGADTIVRYYTADAFKQDNRSADEQQASFARGVKGAG